MEKGKGCIDVSRAINSFFFPRFLPSCRQDGQVLVTRKIRDGLSIFDLFVSPYGTDTQGNAIFGRKLNRGSFEGYVYFRGTEIYDN